MFTVHSEESWSELQQQLALLDHRLALLVTAMQQSGRMADELAPFRGLVVSDTEALALSAGVGDSLRGSSLAAELRNLTGSAAFPGVAPGPLDRVAARFGLGPLDQLALTACLAAELDRKYEKLYGYLQDDVTRRRPSPGLIMDLAGLEGEARLEALDRFLPGAPLLRMGLLNQPDQALPLISRPIHMDPAVLAFLTGHDRPAAELRPGPGADRERAAGLIGPDSLQALERWLGAPGGLPVVVLQGAPGSGKTLLAAALCQAVGWPMLLLDLARRTAPLTDEQVRHALRDVALRNGALCVTAADQESGTPADWQLLSDMAFAMTVPLLICTTRPWHLGHLFRQGRLTTVEVAAPDEPARLRLWTEAAAGTALAPDVDLTALAGRYRLTPGQIADAWRLASHRAARREPGGSVTREDLRLGCRAQARHGLGKLATRLRGGQGWDRLVLPESAMSQLREFCNRVKYRHKVYTEWGFAGGQTRGLGLSALFEGASGTGKTLAAEVVATELGVDAYRIDLSQVVSKYIGETEKNLARVFQEAEESQALLFFDEADSIFGKRTEVKDAHDRYANIEINYLLQRMEEYDGLVVLATNRADDLDEAFKRRIGYQIHFPQPDPASRQRIWRVHLPKQAPLGDDVDLDLVATRLSVPGGNIRNIVLGAAFLAASEDRAIGMEHIMRAAAREYVKAGRHVSEAEFGPYYQLVRR